MKRFTDEEKQSIIQQYQAGKSSIYLAKVFRRSDNGIRDMLRSQGIPLRSTRESNHLRFPLSAAQQLEVCVRYLQGERMSALALAYGVREWIIRRCVCQAAIPLHGRFHHTVNHAAFDLPMTEEKAYWLGFMMADGAIIYDRRPQQNAAPQFALALQLRDRAHVDRFRAFLQATHPVRISQQKYPAAFLRITSAPLVAVLEKFGITREKTHHGQVRYLTLNRHFWRGVVDGDGHVGADKRRHWAPILDLCGSQSLLRQFSAFVQHNIPNYLPKVHQHKTIWRIEVYGAHAEQMLHILYDRCHIALSRKQFRVHSLFSRQYYLPF